MACPAGGHAPCGDAGTAPLHNACRVSRHGALSVDPLAPQVTLEQPELPFNNARSWPDLTDMVVGCTAWLLDRQVYGNEIDFA